MFNFLVFLLGYTCQPDPCRNGGTCSVDGKGYFTCSCPKRFFGYFCEYKQGNLKNVGDL